MGTDLVGVLARQLLVELIADLSRGQVRQRQAAAVGQRVRAAEVELLGLLEREFGQRAAGARDDDDLASAEGAASSENTRKQARTKRITGAPSETQVKRQAERVQRTPAYASRLRVAPRSI